MSLELVSIEQVMSELDPNWEKSLDSKQVVSGLTVYNEIIDEMKKGKVEPMRVDWPMLTEKFGGFRPGELTTLTGDTGMGKTTWAANIVSNLMPNDHKPLVFSLEQGPKDFIRKIFRMVCGEGISESSAIKYFEQVSDHLGPNKLFLYSGQDFLKRQHFRLVVAWAVLNHGCKFVLLDHFEMILDMGMDAAQIGRVAAYLRALAYKLNIHIMAIVHPSKIRGDSKERVVEMDDIKGSSGIKQYSDNVFSIFFDKEDKKTQVKLHKIRHDDYGRYMGDSIYYTLGNSSLNFWEEKDG